jgi:hypothetical protein
MMAKTLKNSLAWIKPVTANSEVRVKTGTREIAKSGQNDFV